MKTIMKLLSALFVLTLFSIFTSCEKPNPTDGIIDPFINDRDERNMIVVISDIHLGANLDYAECEKNIPSLEKLLTQIKTSPNVKELVIAGDFVDEWFVPANIDTYQGQDQANFIQRVATTNKGVFDIVNSIIQEGKIRVTYVPGNHDLTVTAESIESVLPGINQARDPMLGLGTYSPLGYPQIAIEHGHRYNFFCAPDPISNQDIAPGTITPPGYFFTRIGALHVAQGYPAGINVVPEVTPNSNGGVSQDLLYAYWKIWKNALSEFTINNRFDEDIIVTNFDGFTGSFSVNDILPYQTTTGGLIEVDLFDGIQDTWEERQTSNGVAVHIPVLRAIAKAADEKESGEQAKNQYFMNPNSNKRIVIFGHTHVAKMEVSNNHLGQKAIYVNSGTWIDENNLSSTNMNFVVITPQNAYLNTQTLVKLYSFQNEVVKLVDESSLRF